MKRLLIFDIDETLLSSRHDISCFVQAFEDVQGLKGFPVGMSFYASTTDMGIAGEIISSAYGRPATAFELQTIQDRYCVLLEERCRCDPASVRQVPGAARILKHLRADPSNHVALATGAWASTAALKLRLAGLEVEDLPLTTSDDAASRIDIVRLAIERAKRACACEAFDVVVLIGDGSWDLEVARALGVEFIGIGEYLRRSGAKWVFDDLRDLVGFASAFESFSRSKTEGRQMAKLTGRRVFLAGPFKNVMDPVTGLLSRDMRDRLETVIGLLESKRFAVHCAHRREAWGANMMTPAECTQIDYEEISGADVLLAFPGAPASPGTHVELGWASAMKKHIVLLLEHSKEYAFLVRGLDRITDVTTIIFEDDKSLFRQLDAVFSRYADELELSQT
jgi:phosphoglycolate phosphatase-like HAD superfamily hydrolase/nucleoside 2-deoxyribosyltransferase